MLRRHRAAIQASVVAMTDMTVEVIDRQDFRRLLDQYPDLYAPLFEATTQRLSELEGHS